MFCCLFVSGVFFTKIKNSLVECVLSSEDKYLEATETIWCVYVCVCLSVCVGVGERERVVVFVADLRQHSRSLWAIL